MHTFTRVNLLLIVLLGISVPETFGENASEPVTLKLWPGKPPKSVDPQATNQQEMTERIGVKVTRVAQPELVVYAPAEDKRNGSAIVICPGGGYHILAWDLEGVEVARWLNSIGVTACVLKYRVPRVKQFEKQERPLLDVQRALRTVRHRAKEWSLDPERIGVLGFSAGGHLSATAATNFEQAAQPIGDGIDKQSAKPNAALLIYPAYLQGERPADPNTLTLASDIPVGKNTPPTFLVHAHDDRVSPLGSIAYYAAMKANDRPAELHIFPTGGHGYGLRPTEEPVTRWPKLAEVWLDRLGWLSDSE